MEPRHLFAALDLIPQQGLLWVRMKGHHKKIIQGRNGLSLFLRVEDVLYPILGKGHVERGMGAALVAFRVHEETSRVPTHTFKTGQDDRELDTEMSGEEGEEETGFLLLDG